MRIGVTATLVQPSTQASVRRMRPNVQCIRSTGARPSDLQHVGKLGPDGFDAAFPTCPLCGSGLTPRQTEVGRPAIELLCDRHGVQQVWSPFTDRKTIAANDWRRCTEQPSPPKANQDSVSALASSAEQVGPPAALSRHRPARQPRSAAWAGNRDDMTRTLCPGRCVDSLQHLRHAHRLRAWQSYDGRLRASVMHCVPPAPEGA